MNCDELRDGFELSDKIGSFQQTNRGNFEDNRRKIRDELVDLFKLEKAGLGKGIKSTRIIYCVEKINEDIIYLKRPATLNNGFDFEIHTKIKHFNGRIKSRPRHQDIFDILNDLKHRDIMIFNRTQIIIDEIYVCNDSHISSIKYEINNIEIEVILKLIKWLFLEQDITYWSFSGREMFYSKLKSL